MFLLLQMDWRLFTRLDSMAGGQQKRYATLVHQRVGDVEGFAVSEDLEFQGIAGLAVEADVHLEGFGGGEGEGLAVHFDDHVAFLETGLANGFADGFVVVDELDTERLGAGGDGVSQIFELLVGEGGSPEAGFGAEVPAAGAPEE